MYTHDYFLRKHTEYKSEELVGHNAEVYVVQKAKNNKLKSSLTSHFPSMTKLLNELGFTTKQQSSCRGPLCQ